MKKETGLIHLYFGDGKGKTTTGMGLTVRAVGYGYRVLLYQFMKDNRTSERKILEKIDNITIIDGLEQEKFSFRMTEEEKDGRRGFYAEQFKKVVKLADTEGYDVLFMDEIIYTIRAGLLDEDMVLEFLKNKPAELEVILTGNGPSERMIEAVDYASEVRKVKHPFDRGIKSRLGIEK